MTPEQFLQFADPLPEPTLLISGSGFVLAVNRAAQHQLGLPFDPANQTSLTSLVAESSDEVAQFLRRCSSSRQMVLGALTLQRSGGEPITCRAEGAVVRPRQDQSEAILLLRLLPKAAVVGQFLALNEQVSNLNKEILRRRETEEALRRQKEWLQVTLKSIGDAVIATDAVGNVVCMNPMAEKYLGWTEEEVVGRPLTDVFHILNEHTRQRVDNPVAEVIRRGGIVGLANHTVLIDRNGGERPIEDSAAPIKDGEGELLGVILVFHDVTVQRHAERELLQADRRKDEFLATLAHELRNPLAPIRNSLEVLKHLDSGGTEAVQNIHATMDRQLSLMVRLIDDLLDVSRISRGKLELRRQRTELQSILRQSLETCRPLSDVAGHLIDVSLPEEPTYVDGDAVRLAQVFSNLLNNACKFTPTGGRIRLSCVVSSAHIEVSIQDNGVGIPENNLDSIFEMFSQVDSSLERSHGGLGIGLTLVKQVVELHGGSVKAQSLGRGHGSVFTVNLPRMRESAAVPQSTADVRKKIGQSNLRILVVDDNRDSALSLAMLLKLSGNTVHTAFDGAEAIQAAENFGPDVILLDIGLPKLNGYEACRAIRNYDWGVKIVIIALTGWGQEEDRRKSSEAGFNGHLVKPVEHAALGKLLAGIPPK